MFAAILMLTALFLVPSTSLAALVRVRRRLADAQGALRRLQRILLAARYDDGSETASGERVPILLREQTRRPARNRTWLALLPSTIRGWMWIVGISAFGCAFAISLSPGAVSALKIAAIPALSLVTVALGLYCSLFVGDETVRRVDAIETDLALLTRTCQSLSQPAAGPSATPSVSDGERLSSPAPPDDSLRLDEPASCPDKPQA